jgi:hypothetical protein
MDCAEAPLGIKYFLTGGYRMQGFKRIVLYKPVKYLKLTLSAGITGRRRIKKRSSWASGRGKVPEVSTGFWVAINKERS